MNQAQMGNKLMLKQSTELVGTSTPMVGTIVKEVMNSSSSGSLDRSTLHEAAAPDGNFRIIRPKLIREE